MRKPLFGVSDHVRRKPGCTTIEDDRVEIWELGRTGIVLAKTKALIRRSYYQLRSYYAADLRVCFRIFKMPDFS